MKYSLRTGDILLCKNKELNQTNAYLLVYDQEKGFGLWCISCGEALGFYGDDIEKMKADILSEDFLNVQGLVPKEILADVLNDMYSLDLPVKSHDGFNELSITIDI